MGIEINGTSKPVVGEAQKTQQDKQAENKVAGTPAEQVQNNAKSDSVSLTSSGMKINELENRLKEIPEVDHERIHEIKKKIASGDYNIDADSIASKLLQLEARLPRS